MDIEHIHEASHLQLRDYNYKFPNPFVLFRYYCNKSYESEYGCIGFFKHLIYYYGERNMDNNKLFEDIMSYMNLLNFVEKDRAKLYKLLCTPFLKYYRYFI